MRSTNRRATDVSIHSVRIPEDLAARLEELARATKRTKSSFIIEALERFLEEREDLEIALSRLRDPGAEWVDHEDVRHELGVD
jgi:predicted DNA-binding protein